MREWFFPITLLPGVGLLIMSTSNLVIGLGNELSHLISDPQASKHILKSKIEQLRRLNLSLTAFYLSCAMLVISGLINGLAETDQVLVHTVSEILLFLSIVAILMGLVLLIAYSAHAVRIKKRQFEERL